MMKKMEELERKSDKKQLWPLPLEEREKMENMEKENIVREEADNDNPAELFKQSLDPERKEERLDANEKIRQDQLTELQQMQKTLEEMPDKIAAGKESWENYFDYAQQLDRLKGTTGDKNG